MVVQLKTSDPLEVYVKVKCVKVILVGVMFVQSGAGQMDCAGVGILSGSFMLV